MRKCLATALCVALAMGVLIPTAHAAKRWDDLSWWGRSGATPEPYRDPRGRDGYWWWPTQPATADANDQELWGNRGKVFHNIIVAEEVTPTPTPGPTPPPGEQRKVPVLNNVLFDFDKAVLRPEGRAETDKVVNWMKQYPNDTLVIEGHTCDIGTEQYNMGLGQRRADAVKRYMLDSGISPNRVSTVSYGESRPAVPNTGPANRKLNRRAVFEITIRD